MCQQATLNRYCNVCTIYCNQNRKVLVSSCLLVCLMVYLRHASSSLSLARPVSSSTLEPCGTQVSLPDPLDIYLWLQNQPTSSIESHYLNSILHLSSPKHIESDHVHLNESPTDRPMSLAFFTLQKRTHKNCIQTLENDNLKPFKTGIGSTGSTGRPYTSSNYVAKWRGLNIEYWWIFGCWSSPNDWSYDRSTVLECIALVEKRYDVEPKRQINAKKWMQVIN